MYTVHCLCEKCGVYSLECNTMADVASAIETKWGNVCKTAFFAVVKGGLTFYYVERSKHNNNIAHVIEMKTGQIRFVHVGSDIMFASVHDASYLWN